MTRTLISIVLALLGTHALRAQEPARTEGWVVLSVDDYRKLRSSAFPAAPDPVSPPIDSTLTRVDYQLRADGDAISGEARLTIDVFKQGWVTVQVPSGLLVRGARLDGRRTALLVKPGGAPPRVLVSRTGRSVLTLDVVAPISSSGAAESVTLPASSSAVSAVTLTLPRGGIDMIIAGGVTTEQTDTPTESRWVVYGVPGKPLSFTWKRKVDDRRAAMPLRVRVRITQLVALGEDSTQITASVRTEIVQGLARDITLNTPDGVVVNQVSGATVADWNQQQGSLRVSFLDPVSTEAAIVVSAETRTARDGSVTVPLIRMPAAERETGGVAVDVVGAGEVADQQPRGLDPTDPLDLGDVVSGRESPSMVAFRHRPLAGDAARSLTLTVSRYTPQAVLIANLEEARYEALIGEDGKALVHARFAVRNNQRSFLAVTLPTQSVLWSASLAGHPVRPGVSPNGSLLLPLQKGLRGHEAPTFAVEIAYLQRTSAWGDKGTVRIELPSVDLPASRTGLIVHYSPRYRIEPQAGAFRIETDSGPWSAALRGGRESVLVGVPFPAAPPASEPMAHALLESESASKSSQVRMQQLRKEMGRAVTGVVPVEVRLPDLGPSVFVVAELTPENRAPALEIEYRRVSR